MCKKQTKNNTVYAGASELYVSEKYLKLHNLIIVKSISKYLRAQEKVLEFGAGIGTLALLYSRLNKIKPDCVEIDKALQRTLVTRKLKVFDSIDFIFSKYDGIYSSNVLEHIRNDTVALQKLNFVLKRNGLLVLYLPAFMCLYSDMDRAVGHYRRYEKKEIIKKLEKSNFKVINHHFVDSLGFFALLAIKLLGYKNKKNINRVLKSGLGQEEHLKFYGHFITPLSILLDNLGAKFFFGKNIFIVAQKK
jgi:SAM-dependent methyltransferase